VGKAACQEKNNSTNHFLAFVTSSGLLRLPPDAKPSQHVPTQRCPRLAESLFHRLPTPDRLLIDDVPGSRLGVEQNPFQDLLDHRPQTPRSRSTLQGNPGDLLHRRISERQVRSVEPDQFSELLDQRILRSLK